MADVPVFTFAELQKLNKGQLLQILQYYGEVKSLSHKLGHEQLVNEVYFKMYGGYDPEVVGSVVDYASPRKYSVRVQKIMDRRKQDGNSD